MIVRNEDYIKGVKFLLEKCKEKGVNIHPYHWVGDLSMILSWFGACHKFWSNVYEQNRLDRIPLCETVDDIMHYPGRILFQWQCTPEGGMYWCLLLTRDLFPYSKSRIKLNELRFLYGEK